MPISRKAPRIQASLMAVTALCSTATLSEPGGHGAHIHGVAELTLAKEGSEIELMLSLPADSLLGFESRAVSPEQIEAVAAAKASLADGEVLFTFSGADCALREADVDVSAVMADEEHHDEHDDHDEHEEHEGEEHGEHDERDEHGHAQSHSDIVASYEFECADDGLPESVRVGNGGLPYGLETINVMWVTAQSQGGATLDGKQNAFELR